VGGAIAIIGGAFIVRSMVVRPDVQVETNRSKPTVTLPSDRID
jgi:hypothetical protein